MLFFFRPAFERYSIPARQVMMSAITAAHQLGSRELRAEHLILGLIDHDPDFLKRLITPATAHALAENLRTRLPIARGETRGDLPLTTSAKAVMKGAESWADKYRSRTVLRLHILAGAATARTAVATILQAHGITPGTVSGAFSGALPE